MVVASHLMKANIGLHGFQGLWSVVLMGVIGVGMVHPGSAGGAPKFLFALVSGFGGLWTI